jgi:hypothetical protein
MIANGEFLEWAEVFGNFYGTGVEDTERRLAAGEDLLLVIDVQGAAKVRANGVSAVSIFVLPPSFRVLDQVAKLVLEHSELKKIRVEGHTDNVGSAHYNKDLSERRAASVVRYLAGKGIPRERLTPAGFGFEQPVASNATALGRAKNRRVEFRILTE